MSQSIKKTAPQRYHITLIRIAITKETGKNIWGLGSLGGSDSKESACSAGDLGLIPVLGRSSGKGNGNPLQYSYLENPMDMGSQRVGQDRVTSLSLCVAGPGPGTHITEGWKPGRGQGAEEFGLCPKQESLKKKTTWSDLRSEKKKKSLHLQS